MTVSSGTSVRKFGAANGVYVEISVRDDAQLRVEHYPAYHGQTDRGHGHRQDERDTVERPRPPVFHVRQQRGEREPEDQFEEQRTRHEYGGHRDGLPHDGVGEDDPEVVQSGERADSLRVDVVVVDEAEVQVVDSGKHRDEEDDEHHRRGEPHREVLVPE